MTRKQALLSLLTICSAPIGMLGQVPQRKKIKEETTDPHKEAYSTSTDVISISDLRYDPSFTLFFKDDQAFKISLVSEEHAMLVKWKEKEIKIILDDLMNALS